MVLGLRRTTVSERVGLLFCARPHPGSLRSPTLPFGDLGWLAKRNEMNALAFECPPLCPGEISARAVPPRRDGCLCWRGLPGAL
jgi:hypothetical protein